MKRSGWAAIKAHGARIPSGIWALGFVSLLMDVSSEMIHALLPVYLVTAMGVSAATVGVIEGAALATATLTKVFSGGLSDWLGRRKPLVVLGYGLAALTKPVFPLAQTVEWIVAARLVDRVGKGIRGAPRNALIADISPPDLRGASFGLRQSLDSLGAFIGPLLAMLCLLSFDSSYRTVFWMAFVPAALAVLLLIFAVHEPEDHAAQGQGRKPPLKLADLKQLPPAYWAVLVLTMTIALARFSEAFLVLQGNAIGVSALYIPAVFLILNATNTLTAYPAGALSDRIGRRGMLAAGLGVLVVADLCLAGLSGWVGLVLGTALWGVHLGLTEGVLDAIVADHAPAHLRGSAFGLFNLAMGIGLFVASVLAGVIWDVAGASSTFLFGAGLAGMSLVVLALIRR